MHGINETRIMEIKKEGYERKKNAMSGSTGASQ